MCEATFELYNFTSKAQTLETHLHFNNKVIYFIAYLIIPLRIMPLIKLNLCGKFYNRLTEIISNIAYWPKTIKYKTHPSHTADS